MGQSALVGLGIALLGGPLLWALVWHAPIAALTPREVLASALGPALVYALTCALARLVLGALGVDEALGPPLAYLLGDVVALTLVGVAAYRTRLVGTLRMLTQGLVEPASKARSLRALEALADAAKPRPGAPIEPFGRLVVHIAAALVTAGEHEAARRMLERVESAALPPGLHATHAQSLARVCLELGELSRARAALDTLRDPVADPMTARWFCATEALLYAVEGDAQRALALAGEVDDEGDEPAFRASFAIVRAHARARLGDEEGARGALALARSIAGPAALGLAMRPVGPATELARAMLDP